MEASQQRKLNQGQSESAFMKDSRADFPRDSPGEKTEKLMDVQIALILTLAGEQSSQAARSNVGIKDDLFDDLDVWLRKINRGAVALEDEIPDIRDLFRLPRNRSEENRLATARNFHTASAPYETEFEDFVPASFRADLMSIITQIEAVQAAADTGRERTGGATGGMVAAFKELGRLMNKLNAIVKNKYADNPQKLAAWAIASHLERAPQRTKTDVPPVG